MHTVSYYYGKYNGDTAQGPSTQWADKNMMYLAAPFMVVFGGKKPGSNVQQRLPVSWLL